MTGRGPEVDRRSLRRWAAALARAHPDPLAAAAAATQLVADRLGVTPPAELPATGAEPDRAAVPPPPAAWCNPRLPGQVYEALLDPSDRRARGAWFTPAAVVDGLVALALADEFDPATVLDPTCGAGAFLLGVADALRHRGLPAGQVLDRLVGVDLDPGAIRVCRWSLDLWAAAHGTTPGGGHLVVADSLEAALPASDLVVGNPPFGSPLRTARAQSPSVRYRAGRGHLGPYADDAACFLDRAVDLVRPGGRLALVLPHSVLASRDAAGVVERFATGWALRHLWLAETPVFDAGVHVFAPVLHRHPADGPAPDPAPVALHRDRAVVAAGRVPAGSTWGQAAAGALGIPAGGTTCHGPTLGTLATATSGFRDQHYGLAAVCREAGERPGGAPLVTVGQIDPLHWRRDRPIRFGGRLWSRPVVDVEALGPHLAGWVARQQRPKVLLATQGRVLEPLIDRVGDLVPATPVVAIHADPADLDRVAAVLLAPPVVAWAARRSVGTALQPHAIKLAARQVLEAPLPPADGPWSEAAAMLAPVDATRPAGPELLGAVAALMCRAYGVDREPLWTWWWRRLPHRRAAGTPRAAVEGAGRVAP